MARRYFEQVDETLMPGKAKVGYEVLTGSFDRLVPGFRNMLHQLLTEPYMVARGDHGAICHLPHGKKRQSHYHGPAIIMAHLQFPAKYEPSLNCEVNDPTRHQMVLQMYPLASYKGSKADLARELIMKWKVGDIGIIPSNLDVTASVRSGRNISLSRGVHFSTEGALERFTQRSVRRGLDATIESQYSDERYLSVMHDTVELALQRMEKEL